MERRTNSEPNWTLRELNPGRTDVFHNAVNCHRLRYSKAVIFFIGIVFHRDTGNDCTLETCEVVVARQVVWIEPSSQISSAQGWKSSPLHRSPPGPLEPSGANGFRWTGWAFSNLSIDVFFPISTSTFVLVRKVTKWDHSSIAHLDHLGCTHRHVTF